MSNTNKIGLAERLYNFLESLRKDANVLVDVIEYGSPMRQSLVQQLTPYLPKDMLEFYAEMNGVRFYWEYKDWKEKFGQGSGGVLDLQPIHSVPPFPAINDNTDFMVKTINYEDNLRSFQLDSHHNVDAYWAYDEEKTSDDASIYIYGHDNNEGFLTHYNFTEYIEMGMTLGFSQWWMFYINYIFDDFKRDISPRGEVEGDYESLLWETNIRIANYWKDILHTFSFDENHRAKIEYLISLEPATLIEKKKEMDPDELPFPKEFLPLKERYEGDNKEYKSINLKREYWYHHRLMDNEGLEKTYNKHGHEEYWINMLHSSIPSDKYRPSLKFPTTEFPIHKVSIQFYGNNYPYSLKSLNHFKKLAYLNLGWLKSGDVLKHSKLPSLKSLDLKMNTLTNLDFLKGMPNLVELKVRISSIVPEEAPCYRVLDLRMLKHLKNLEISFDNYREEKKVWKLEKIIFASNIEEVNLGGLNTNIPFLENGESIERLYLQGFQISEINNISHLANLGSLTIDDSGLQKISHLENHLKLYSLSLDRNQIKKIENLEKLPINDLQLSDNKITVIENVSHLSLERLNLNNNQIKVIGGLEAQSKLEGLDIAGNPLQDLSGLDNIPKKESYYRINLSLYDIKFSRKEKEDIEEKWREKFSIYWG